jgi:hypothetical protein
MSDKKDIFLTFALLFFTFTFVPGCGRYITQYSAPTIISRSPAIDATLVSSHEVIWLKFSKIMDINNLDLSQLQSIIKSADDMNAVITTDAVLTPEAVWVEDNTKLVVTNVIFTSIEGAARVHLIASKEGFGDTNGLFLQENTDLWNYTLE